MNTEHYQAWQTPKAGAISDLSMVDLPLTELKKGLVRINVKAIGLNFADIFALTGLYSATPKGAFVPGLEYSGEVIESQSESFSVGDRVMGVTRFGGYTTLIDSEPEYLTLIPKDWSYDQGAAYLVQTLTAYYALVELGNLKPNQNVLIHSAAGGVGLQAMKLCKAMNANPIGTVSSASKKEFLIHHGFEQILIRDNNFARQLIREEYNFDLVLDGIGGDIQKASFNHLNPMGRLIVFGAAEFTPGKNRPKYLSSIFKYLKRPKYDVMNMISDNKSVLAFNLIWLWQQVPFLTQLLQDMMAINIQPPHVGHRYDFSEAHKAIETLRCGNNIGKVILNCH